MYLPKFPKLSSPTLIASSHSLWKEVIQVGKLDFENCGRYIFLTPYIFANGLHFVALNYLWVPKTWSKYFYTLLSYRYSES